MSYPNSERSLGDLFNLSLRYYWHTLAQVYLFIVLFVLCKAVVTYVSPTSVVLNGLLEIIIVAAGLLLVAMALYRTDAVLRDQPVSLLVSWQQVLQRILWVYAAVLLVVVGFIVLFLLSRWLILRVFGLEGVVAGFVILLVVGIPLLIGLIFFYFTIPLIVLEKTWGKLSLWLAFSRSIEITQKNWMEVIVLYIGVVVVLVIVTTHSRHGQWLLHHHLMEIFDLVVLLLAGPVLLNLSLLIMHNSQLSRRSN